MMYSLILLGFFIVRGTAHESLKRSVDCECGYVWKPVCGEDGRQFDNPCIAKCHRVEAWTDGECPQIEDVCVQQLSKKKCKAFPGCAWSSRKERCSISRNPRKDCACGYDWQPVCSKDLRQFDNPCSAACHGVEAWTDGECSLIENVCVLQLTRKDCKAVSGCAWSGRKGRCIHRNSRKDASPIDLAMSGTDTCEDCVAAGRSWQHGQCNPSEECEFMDVGCATTAEICQSMASENPNFCAKGCRNYFDGCNMCKCLSDGGAVCTLMACPEDLMEPAKCLDEFKCDCGYDWQPVCSDDYRQFDNPCLAECHGVEDWTDGECPESCDCGFDFQPVCSEDLRQFDNPCLAECHGVESWTEGECPESCDCGFDFLPVCSEDLRQFDNPCLAECHGVASWTEGECPESCACGFDFQPVCSEDFRQFDNPCLAECHGVESWTDGECPQIEDVCVLQLTRKDCRDVPECSWSKGRCSYRNLDSFGADSDSVNVDTCEDCVAAGRSWQVGQCNPTEECEIMDIGCATTAEICKSMVDEVGQDFCAQGCSTFFDGCNICKCRPNSDAACTMKECSEDMFEPAVCIDKFECDCGYDWQPVCSDDGHQFSNPCLAECYGVESWTDGECPESCACGFDFQPVCSEDLRQFVNRCLAECHGVESWTEGECPESCACGFDFQPVCSEDFRQFDNPCLAECHGVESWTDGECPQIEDVCVLQLTRKDCRAIPDCSWSGRKGQCGSSQNQLS